jgi:hypothetical protein
MQNEPEPDVVLSTNLRGALRPDGEVYRMRHLVGLDDTITPERPAAVGELEGNAFREDRSSE